MPTKRSAARGKTSDKAGEASLTRERIIVAAVELLDAQGVEGLTMRGLAERLGSGVMSLYWHVSKKEDVLDLAVDAVLAYRAPSPAVDFQDWRQEVMHVLEDWRDSMLRHPWAAALLPRRALGPNILARLEILSRTLSAAGVADADLNAAIWSLWNHVMGATMTRASFTRSADDLAAAQQSLADYPSIERSRLLLESDWDGTFGKGLAFLLDGLVPRT